MNSRARRAAIAAAGALLACATAQSAHAMRAYVNYDSLVISADPGEANLLTVKLHPTTAGAFLIADPAASIRPGAGCASTLLKKVVTCTIAEEYAYHPPSLSLSLGDGNDIATVEGSYYILQADAGIGDDRLDLPGVGGFGSGYEHVQLGAGADTLKLGGSYGAQVEVHGGDGWDDIDAADVSGGYVHGGRGNDRIKANGWVSGGDGADTLDGTGNFGWDHYFGDAGNDTINTSDFSVDVVDCGAGTDSATPDELDEVTGCEP